MNLSNEEKAYLAGIIDGEGSIFIIERDNWFALRLSIATTSNLLHDWLANKLERDLFTYDITPGVHNKISYFICTGKRAKEIICEVYDYLIIKKELAEVALSFPIAEPPYRKNSQEHKLQQALCFIKAKKLQTHGKINNVIE